MKQKTEAIHAGVYQDKTWGSVTTPIYPSSTFTFPKLGEHPVFDYTRSGNPTRAGLEESLAALEGGKVALATSTGMSAITTTLFLFQSGDHVIAGNDIYGGTYRLFDAIMPKMGINFTFVDMRDPDAVRAAIRPETKGLWIETPSNPLLNITDVKAMTAIAREHKLLTIADNTFLSPVFQRPLDLGVDIVLHSTTKYINGHSDVVGGAVIAADPEIGQRVRDAGNAIGTACSPFDAFLVLRGIKTLPVRMAEHARNAQVIAAWLEKHPRVQRVYYPGLDSHPQKALIDQQMLGPGGMLSFDLDADEQQIPAFYGALELFLLAESLGGVESLVEQPWSMSHASMGPDGLAASGITPQTVRVSVGLEATEDLIADLERGFAAIG
ncbi:trans-sulfuration enzyme family protein [Mucisphaera calidilacus]|uniref:Cystathionine gamma-synthase n=1 Tax=Mucisphaera calidilacus TaxID=2527982 RepID=A0A518BUR9_9BACT|nr:PLP-dependent aspartate aminotransferase family protein [Mucisphaera calidilacus]QDU70732.1 Cystathionine gamma-synthase [Mucisphaera calidilacus]